MREKSEEKEVEKEPVKVSEQSAIKVRKEKTHKKMKPRFNIINDKLVKN